MASPPGPEPLAKTSRRSPRWWRRGLVVARRANFYFWLEIVAAAALIVMLASSYLALTGDPEAWEPWESALVLVTVTVGAGGLIVLGWFVDRFILS